MMTTEHLSGRLEQARSFIGGLYAPGLHAKRIGAPAGATLGVKTDASLAVAMIGQAQALARRLVANYAVKQVDRLMSAGIGVWDGFARRGSSQVGANPGILAAVDWTGFGDDGYSMLALSPVMGHGQAAPLIRLSVRKEEIAPRRNDCEDACLVRLAETLLPSRGGAAGCFASGPQER